MAGVAVSCKFVSKNFRLYSERRDTVFEHLQAALTRKPSHYEVFPALKGISFELGRGEALGLIGGNGSGKSTLLKIISGIMAPSSGSVMTRGRVTALLELGVGFQPDLTARENISIYAAILGLSAVKTRELVPKALEFAELEKFADMKVKNYSSGMYARLAFATAIHAEPDILLVDEILAVGDLAFQAKCHEVFRRFRDEGKTIILATHDLSAVRNYCDKVLLLRSGEMAGYGKADEVIDQYVYSSAKIESDKQKLGSRWGDKRAAITHVELLDKFGSPADRFNSGDPLTVRIHYHAREKIFKPVFGIAIHRDDGLHVFGTNTEMEGVETKSIEGEGWADCRLESLPLREGRFAVTTAIHSSDHHHYDWRNRDVSFTVIPRNQDGLMSAKAKWELGKTP